MGLEKSFNNICGTCFYDYTADTISQITQKISNIHYAEEKKKKKNNKHTIHK